MEPVPLFRKTRLAPTPSGFLHLGNAFSFRLTATLAQKTGAGLLLRIDDLDQQRVRPEYVDDIFTTLRFLNIQWNEGPQDSADFEAGWSQRHRLLLYQLALDKLRNGGHIFACTCSRADVLRHSADGTYPGTCRDKGIPLDAPGVNWRLHADEKTGLQVKGITGFKSTHFLPAGMQYFVVRKKDGNPAYQLTSVVDDLHFGIDLVVRGADLWPSTLAQLYLATLLGHTAFLETAFYHHPLLTDGNGVKLSKSAGAESIRNLQLQNRHLPEVNALFAQSEGANYVDFLLKNEGKSPG